jgi:quercetin dioxygenase-like cupin family protein
MATRASSYRESGDLMARGSAGRPGRRAWLGAIAMAMLCGCGGPTSGLQIPIEELGIGDAQKAARPGVQVRGVLANQIKEVHTGLVSITGPGAHEEPAHQSQAVVWLVLDGKGTLRTKGEVFKVEGETLARAPQGWEWRGEAAEGETIHALRVKRDLTAEDLEEYAKYPQNNTGPLVKKFSECEAYREAIKSPKTVSRTLLPENFVPRLAMGTVETTGPDKVGAHRHPMLEQLFLGLRGNDITVTADEARANLTQFSILHIPLGSNHGAEVADGKKLHYIWMDFFMEKKVQEWLKMHQPIEPKK